ncbi:MAG: phosphoglycerate dehydrogenase [Bacteroidia bacterium]|nr:phosphoglycerate dehydrogenase [Bacteroidia bacterium]
MNTQETLVEKQVFIDFDQTFIQVDSLVELAEISLAIHPEKEGIIDKIKTISSLMEGGELSVEEGIIRRIRLLQARKEHIPLLVEKLKGMISPSINRNRDFLKQANVFIYSYSFEEIILPVLEDFEISSERVFANAFIFDEDGYIVGFDTNRKIATNEGKSKLIQDLELKGEVLILGDSYTDYQVKEKGIADKFFAFTENKLSEGILGKADHIVPTMEEFLFLNNFPMALSYPKNRIKVLLLENIHPHAEHYFRSEGYQVSTVSRALSEDELIEAIKGVSIIGIRSKTQITRRVLEHANRLMVIGAFCIGTNQIDLEAAADHGVVAFNAPYSNTRSVVELAIGEIILLMRRVPYFNRLMHQGKWNKSAKDSYEVRGKSLGIIGYGNIGAQLSVLAEALGMKVYYYDLVEKLALGNAIKVNKLHDLLSMVDIVTLHVDGREDNQNIFGEDEFAAMKPGAVFLNLARGKVVNIEALVKYLKNGHLQGAAVDVYPSEPKSNDDPFVSELLGLDNVILTPHVGGSTQEAQQNIAHYVPSRVMDYINSGNTFGSVNFPNLQLPEQGKVHRLLHIHKNVPGIMSQVTKILAGHDINILGQYLKTNEQIGYAIIDIDRAYDEAVLDELKGIKETIKFRVLY